MNSGFAQFTSSKTTTNTSIEGLQVFPNPVENGKLFIRSKGNLSKKIEIYNVLGKRVLSTSLNKEFLDVSRLSSGIYILKIKTNTTEVSKKLIIR